MGRRSGRIAAALIVSLQLVQVTIGAKLRMEAQFEQCCSLGTNWATEGLKCEKFSGPVPGVPQIEQSLCLEAVDICCVRAYHHKQCELGKSDARMGSACVTRSKSGDDYQRDCCEGCRLGILTGSMGQGCAFKKFAFGNPWDPAFLECCHEASPSTTVGSTSTVDATSEADESTTNDATSKLTTPSYQLSSSSSLSVPTPALDDICELMKGMLCSQICIPTPGSFVCACSKGFTLLEDGKTCRQDSPVDRCKVNNPCDHHCTDRGEAIVCTCRPGFVLADDKHSCKSKPVDTTPLDEDNQINARCPVGYRYNATSQVCDDVDECENNVCLGRCKNTIGSFNCESGPSKSPPHEACPPGYVWDSQDKFCSDIDECDEPGACDPETHVCVNTEGSFTCHALTGTGPKSCPAGFKYDAAAKICKDVDECAEGIHGCLLDQEECRNTDGGYECDIKCQKGFSFSVNLRSCIDVDECAINGSELCPMEGSKCVNHIGSYECTNSNAPEPPNQSNQRSSSATSASGCPAGYKPTANPNEPCTDVNECNEQLHSCDSTEKCINEIGSYRCDPLVEDSIEDGDISEEEYDKSGYKEYPVGGQPTAVDQDEDISVAEPTCFPGYRYNYDTDRCDDIDECLTNQHNCTGQLFLCVNLSGTFRCDCQSGYELNITTHKCQDIDECARGLTECSSGERCINSIGGHQCSPACPPGFEPHPAVESLCQDIDECAMSIHSCPAHTHICVNTNGSYACDVAATCRSGYTRDQGSGQCVDIDECTKGPGCREHERCLNLPGSYDCVPLCGAGWLFNPQTKSCQDVDECSLGRHSCPQGTHTCRNTNGSYNCDVIPPCSNGYRRAQNGSCIDVDECLENVHNCLLVHHQYCINREGTFECVTRLPACDRGYEYSLNTRRCEDIDECANRQNGCDPRLGERCVNLKGTYKCERPSRVVQQQQVACPKGFKYNQRQCVDINECAEGNHNCGNDICYNQPGSYSCAKAITPVPRGRNNRCPAGLRYARNGCVDVNECEETEDACNSDEQCVNTVGSFSCICKTGFRRDNVTQACIDINECQIEENECLPTQRCDNTLGSYTCVRYLSCGTGYTLNAASEICEDDDECLLGTHDCRDGYQCRNTLGSYRCVKNSRFTSTTVPSTLEKHYPRPSATSAVTVPSRQHGTVGRTQIRCPQGYQARGGQCVDINECERGLGACNQMQRCVNTPGSYTCTSRVICGSGYTLDPSGQYCVDVDECAERTHECSRGQICENRRGGYSCSCPRGHMIGPNRECVDIDECTLHEGEVCSMNSECQNTVGSYRCLCKAGFENVGDRECRDVDECKNPGMCQHICINAWGSYKCACKPGYRLNLDNRSCSDVDECTEFKGNDLCVGICQNTPGSYACQCPAGYRLGMEGRTCQDIDECATGRTCRGADEMCQNTRGSFRCHRINCPPGYYKDNEKKNRCLRASQYCHTGDQACLRSPSLFSYNYITFVSMLPIPAGQVELFWIKDSHPMMQFSLAFVNARAPPNVMRATENCFGLRRPTHPQAVVVLTRSIPGPQEIELDLSVEMYHNDVYTGSVVAKLFIIVSEYTF